MRLNRINLLCMGLDIFYREPQPSSSVFFSPHLLLLFFAAISFFLLCGNASCSLFWGLFAMLTTRSSFSYLLLLQHLLGSKSVFSIKSLLFLFFLLGFVSLASFCVFCHLICHLPKVAGQVEMRSANFGLLLFSDRGGLGGDLMIETDG